MDLLSIYCISQFFWISIVCSPAWNTENYRSHAPNNSLTAEDVLRSRDYPKTLYDDVQDTLNTNTLKLRYCQKKAECERLKYTTCFGVRLPYSSTSLSLIPGLINQDDVQEKLQKWKRLIHIPRCWAAVQPFLCALYMPKCENGLVDLPSLEMCDIIRYPCRILETNNLWPEEFKCDASFKSKCKNDVRELKFNTTSRCKSPLVHAERESSFYDGVEGCGVQCHDPLFTEEERQDIRTTVLWGSVIAFLFDLYVVLTFIIGWRASKRYPTRVIFYMHICSLLSSFGFMYQFLPWTNDHFICHKDGTRRTSENSIRGTMSCLVNFVIVYCSLIAGIVWFIIFAYTWSLRCKTIGTIKYRKDEKEFYYHIIAWSTASMLTVAILTLGEVDGDSILGICSVGVMNKEMRLVFILVPLSCSLLGVILLFICIWKLCYLKMTSREVISENAKKKIRESIVRLSVFLVFKIIFVFIIFACQIFEYKHDQSYKGSFRKFVVCQLGVVGDIEVENCRMENRPSVLLVQLQLIALFGMHLNDSTWLWTRSTVQIWIRFIKRLMNKEVEQPDMLKKHELIARAFAKRKLLNSEGRLSITFCRSRQDPVGLDFELNSMASNNFSSTWARALPKLIMRRGALTGQSGSNSSQRRNSMDSEISIKSTYSYRRYSVESRRNSQESTVSVQVKELTAKVLKRPRNKRRKGRSYKSSRKMSRRNSNASQASNLESDVLKALKIIDYEKHDGSSNDKRRSAISNIEKDTLKFLGVLNNENSKGDSNTEESDSCHETDALK